MNFSYPLKSDISTYNCCNGHLGCNQGRTQGGLTPHPLELDILQKLYYKRSV